MVKENILMTIEECYKSSDPVLIRHLLPYPNYGSLVGKPDTESLVV